MNRIHEFRTARGWSLQQLASASGTSKSQIDKLERGDRRLTVDWMVRLGKALGCDPRALMLQPGLAPIAAADASATGLIPVRGWQTAPMQKTGLNNQLIFTDTPVDQVGRPAYLLHAKDAYALYVVDDAMIPMFRPRQLLFVNPYKPASPGGGVVVTTTQGGVSIREYVGGKQGAKPSVILRAYHPARRDTTVPLNAIASLHAVVGTIEPQ